MIKMTPITPKRVLSARQLARVVENQLNMSALAVKVDYEVTSQTWKHQPSFTITSSPGERIIGTSDEIYGYVDDGTRPHVIRPRRAKRLRFSPGGRAKTSPGQIRSGAGRKGSGVVFAKQVNHPGTKARNFSKAIAEKWRKLLPQQLQRAIDAEVV